MPVQGALSRNYICYVGSDLETTNDNDDDYSDCNEYDEIIKIIVVERELFRSMSPLSTTSTCSQVGNSDE